MRTGCPSTGCHGPATCQSSAAVRVCPLRRNGEQQPVNFSSLLPKCQVPDEEQLAQVSSPVSFKQPFHGGKTSSSGWKLLLQLLLPGWGTVVVHLAWGSEKLLTLNELLPPHYPHCALVYGVLFNLLICLSPEEMNPWFYLSQHKEGV